MKLQEEKLYFIFHFKQKVLGRISCNELKLRIFNFLLIS